MNAEKQYKESSSRTLQPKQGRKILSFVDNRPEVVAHTKIIQGMLYGAEYEAAMQEAIGDDDIEEVDDNDYSDDYVPDISKMDEYQSPDDYYGDEHNPHHDLQERVEVKYIAGYGPALHFIDNVEKEEFIKLQGSRSRDKTLLHTRKDNYVWHHCELEGDSCLMQLVPGSWHSSWGHVGAAKQAGYTP